MIKNQILYLGLTQVELQTLRVKFPLHHQFYQLLPNHFEDFELLERAVSESLCMFINPKKLNVWQLCTLLNLHETAKESTHAAILLFTSPFTREQNRALETKELHQVNLKAAFNKALRDTVEIVRKATMPCWDGLKRMEANMFNDGWYLLSFKTTGADPLEDEIVSISIAYMANYTLHEETTLYIKQSAPLSAETCEELGITNELLEKGITKEDAVDYLNNLHYPAPFIMISEKYDHSFLKALYHFCGQRFTQPYIALEGLMAIVFGHSFVCTKEDFIRMCEQNGSPSWECENPNNADLYNLTLLVFENLRYRYNVHCPGQFHSLYYSDILCCN